MIGTLARIGRHISFMLPGFAIAGILFALLVPWRRRRLAERGLRSGSAREAAMLLFWMFAGGMAVITLASEPGWLFFGLQGDWTPLFYLDGMWSRFSLIPFSDLDGLYNIIGNIVMFVPFGFFAALLWRGFGWKRALGMGVGITCFIECWQLLVDRTSDIDDIIFNTLGVFCGFLLWRALNGHFPVFTEQFHVTDSNTNDEENS